MKLSAYNFAEFANYGYFVLTAVSFVQVSKKFFPQLAVGFEDPRVHLHIDDGTIN